MWPLGQKASQGAGLCARACSRGAAVSRKPPGGGKGRAKKHTGTSKHHQTVKHKPGHHKQSQQWGSGPPIIVTSHSHQHPKPRKLSPGCDVACCTAEAVGLLLGWGWDEVLALYWRTAADPDSGASIEGTLAAADMPQIDVFNERQPFSAGCQILGRGRDWVDNSDLHVVPVGHGLILGVTLPEPHAVAVTPGGTWWSWGEPFNPFTWPELVVEEAWAVSLP